MRIIGGRNKGRKLVSFKGGAIRPSSDKVREALFDTLFAKGFTLNKDTAVLDLFAGSGALGLEALSRGAGSVIFVDRDKVAVRVVEKNLSLCKCREKSSVLSLNSVFAINLFKKKEEKFDLVFLDPPYNKNLVFKSLKAIVKKRLLKKGAWLIAEHPKTETPVYDLKGLHLIDSRTYGRTCLSYYVFY